MIITQTFTMARWQIVVKPSEATKPTKTKMKRKEKMKKTTTSLHFIISQQGLRLNLWKKTLRCLPNLLVAEDGIHKRII